MASLITHSSCKVQQELRSVSQGFYFHISFNNHHIEGTASINRFH